MDIDFIKWMVGFADEYEIADDRITYRGNWECIGNIHVSPLYPLLLQRAIEGWNLNSPQYYIQQSDYICIYDDWGEPTDFENIPISDEAKEKALEYIYNQEVEGE